MTDESFAPGCDVNNIVRHYETTGLDPYAERKKQERFDEASALSYEDAMRNKAAYDSYVAENPNWQESAAAALKEANSRDPSVPPAETAATPLDASGVAQTAPQDASDGES